MAFITMILAVSLMSLATMSMRAVRLLVKSAFGLGRLVRSKARSLRRTDIVPTARVVRRPKPETLKRVAA